MQQSFLHAKIGLIRRKFIYASLAQKPSILIYCTCKCHDFDDLSILNIMFDNSDLFMG